MKPIIGITCFMKEATYGNFERHAAILPSAYISMVDKAGGIPLIIPPAGDMTSLLDSVDALVVSGGPDICPENYGQSPDPMTREFFPEQDIIEMKLIAEAMRRNMPFLGVCRGMQILSVMHGGCLHQHLDTTPGHEGHGGFNGAETEHMIDIRNNSLLGRMMGESLMVNSSHHQGVADAGSLLVSATASHDNLIEAVENADLDYCIGVQWHPERAGHTILYSELIEAARH